MNDLLGSESDSESKDEILNLDNSYASKYDQWRGKEHLQKLKDKYGDDYEEDDSDDEEEDEDADELTEEVEQDFFATLASLKKKDPKIYDGKTEFFKESASASDKIKSKSSKDQKVTLGDIERKVMLEKGGKFDELEDDTIIKHRDMTYNEEMKSIKESFKTALNDDEEADSILTKRTKTEEETKEEAESYRQWLAGHQKDVEDPKLEAKFGGLREFWNKNDLDEGEKFLKDYILNKRYRDDDEEDYIPSYDEVVHDSDDNLSEDEKNVKKQEEFEHKFNFRFEEPDDEFIKRYPRTIKDTLRKDGDKRIKKRKEVEDRKKREKEQKKDELKMLKNMKKREIMEKLAKLKKITGNDDMELDEEDIEGDFDPQKYDEKMAEIFNNYDDNVTVDEEKPTFSDLDDEEYDEEYCEDWDNWTGAEGYQEEDEELNCEDEGFNMDCDFQQEVIESTKGRKKGRRKSKFAEVLEQNPTKPAFDPEDKTFTEYVDEYYKLDCEDIIGDMPCRFKYRDVQQNDFGLSTEEILSAPDKELNAWVSLRKTCQYRSQDDERKDFHVFRNKGKDSNLKKKIMPTLFETPIAESTEEDLSNKASVSKKRKRNKKKKIGASEPSEKKVKLASEENISATVTENNGLDKKRRKKKKKNVNPNTNNSAIKIQSITNLYEKSAPQNSKTDDLLQFSNERLKAYGVNPNQFKRKLKKEKFRNSQGQK